MIIYLSKSSRSDKKYMVEVDGKTVHFGASGYSDYPTHRDSERKQRYITRHKARENWGKSGMKSAGFWSRWLLWGEPTISGSIKEIERKFNVTIRRRA